MKVAFIGDVTGAININGDLLVSDNGTPVNSIPLSQYAAQQPGFGIDEDMCGHKCLTLEHTPGTNYYIDVIRNGMVYTYYPVEFIGGRPPVIRK